LFFQSVVGAALEYAEDPMEVNKLDVLHVLRKNKRFLGRVVMTYDHLESFKKSKTDLKHGLGACVPKDPMLTALATRTFDEEVAPARSETADTVSANPQAVSDHEQPSEANVATRILFKLRKPS
jgi:hypothetical protein